ncbi:hypothetical protein GCM10008986_16880 [Salinibacillus aidingensis]|uniref:Uncharacterized protein n=1 Tax=Salinibacillus aidingensis TaxID=237684 RepID=A0ABP3L515_9BACI
MVNDLEYKFSKPKLIEMSEIDSGGCFLRTVLIEQNHPNAAALIKGKPPDTLNNPRWINGQWKEG